MNHEAAFALVKEHCPRQAGWLWDTTDSTGCDTAQAVADQYDDDERDAAACALMILASGAVPPDWEPHRA